jgi:hypothetical protein
MKKVVLIITQTNQYCGGAPPPRELLDKIATPRPFEKKVLYIRKNTNDLRAKILYTVVTDSLGTAVLTLPVGKYTVVDDDKKDIALYDSLVLKYKNGTENAEPIDTACLMKHMSSPDFELVVKRSASKKMEVKFNYFHGCNWAGVPCASFRGQYPP